MYVPLLAKALAKWLTWYDLSGDAADGNRTIDEGCHLYCLRALTGSASDGGLKANVAQWAGCDESEPWFVPRADAPGLLREIFAKGSACTCGGAGDAGTTSGLEDCHGVGESPGRAA